MSLTVNQVTFSYTAIRPLLKKVNLKALTGELVAIVGPSGTGKSTLLRIIAGLLPRPGTEHKIEGTVLLGASSASSVTPGTIALMFQEPVLLPNRTVEGNIALPLEMLRVPSAVVMDRVARSITEVGLAAARGFWPSQLSTGMKTRVALAMTIVTQPSFLLLDEPFSALDIGWRLTLYRALSRWKAVNRPTIVLVTHDLREALLLADTVFILNSDGFLSQPLKVTPAKPLKFTPEELGDFNERSLGIYSEIERLVIEATRVAKDPEEHR